MKLSRIAAAVTTAALAPAVLISSPAFAAGQEAATSTRPTAPTAPDRAADQSDTDQAEQDRKTILVIITDPMASEYMKEAGHKAIADGPAAMRKFIETDQHDIRIDDYRVLITRLLHSAGRGLKQGIKELLQSDQVNRLEQLRHFYEVTQHELRDGDNRVDIARLIGTGGSGVREAGEKALKGTPADRIAFLATGRYLAQASDDRVELARIDEGWDGPILSEAIGKLFDGSPTPAELRHFLEVTQYELRDQDNRVAIARIIDGGGPELVKAGRAALAGTAADRGEFLKTGQHEARAKDKKTQQENDKNNDKDKDQQDRNNPGTGTGTNPGTGTGSGAGTGTGNTTVTPQGGSGSPLASTGAGDSALIAGGAGTALVAGAGLLLAARMRRAAAAAN
ncbi:ALF repeat-containing protein [Streptomyces sp. NPDC051567]|uniref:ALF repeat-containing protein n=1 Tax=Streptomyces sp. NPDC051567 TaxID=3365660 RepID=UPI00379485FB